VPELIHAFVDERSGFIAQGEGDEDFGIGTRNAGVMHGETGAECAAIVRVIRSTVGDLWS